MAKYDESKVGLKKEIGLAGATAVVVGNIIGSAIYMLPQTLANAADCTATLIGWLISAGGTIVLALVFANLGEKYPHDGGPVQYARDSFGNLAGFLTVWIYWIGAWICDAAVTIGSISYLSYFIPALKTNGLYAFLAASIVLWAFTLINIKGSKEVGIVAVITTIAKIIPLLVFIVIAAMHFNVSNLTTVSTEVASKGQGIGTGVASATGVTLWAFLGIESASIAAGDVKDPRKNVKRATLFGTIIAVTINILLSVGAMGAVPQQLLADSASPLADVVNAVTGSYWGGSFFAFGAIISCLGATSGWILITARMALEAGEEGLFPKTFAKINPKTHTPVNALVISSVLANLLLLLNFVGTMQSAYNFMVLVGTLASIPVLLFSCCAQMVLFFKRGDKITVGSFLKNNVLALIGFAYSIYAIYGTGANAAMWGLIAMFAAIPILIYVQLREKSEAQLPEGVVEQKASVI